MLVTMPGWSLTWNFVVKCEDIKRMVKDKYGRDKEIISKVFWLEGKITFYMGVDKPNEAYMNDFSV